MADERPAGGTREQILHAANEVLRDEGLGGATVRAIARRAGCAEGSIYRYWPDKHDLFMELVRTRFPAFLELMASLPDRAGSETVRGNLQEVALEAVEFYRAVVPMAAGAVTERDLLDEHRRYFRERETGPLKFLEAVAGYLHREQGLGRIAAGASSMHAARVLLGTCFAQAFLETLMGDEANLGPDERFAREVVRTVLDGIRPKDRAIADP